MAGAVATGRGGISLVGRETLLTGVVGSCVSAVGIRCRADSERRWGSTNGWNHHCREMFKPALCGCDAQFRDRFSPSMIAAQVFDSLIDLDGFGLSSKLDRPFMVLVSRVHCVASWRLSCWSERRRRSFLSRDSPWEPIDFRAIGRICRWVRNCPPMSILCWN